MTASSVVFFLCGDVMLGRGIDQILAHPSDPQLHEPAVRSALEYVRLAEAASGPIPRAVSPDYVWGEALSELARLGPAARIINLETGVTKSADFVPKGINYRMNPKNVGVISAAAIDCCVLANNHVLDFGREGLIETFDTLHRAGIKIAGAGSTLAEAQAPAILGLPEGNGRVLVFAFGHRSSGIPGDWAATAERPGIAFLADFSERTLTQLAQRVEGHRRPGDLLIASVHWGGNWGYDIGSAGRGFAHRLIEIGFDIIYGHSSHHPKAIEIYRDRLILYGCGDFLNDYEGIPGYEGFRGDLSLMYVPSLCAATGRLVELRLVPFKVARFRLQRATAGDTGWLRNRLDCVCQSFGTTICLNPDATLAVYRR